MSAGQYLDIPTTARTVLDGVVAHYAASGVELPGLRYIGPGGTRDQAWYCEEVCCTSSGVVWGQGPGVGAGVARRTGNPVSSMGVRYAAFSVQVVRCVPVFDPNEDPDPDLLTTSGIAVLTDVGMISQALVELCGPGGPLKRMGVATAGDVETIGPLGGFTATEGHLTITQAQLSRG